MRAILSVEWRMETTRLETFSDGVFAIAATLLILDVHRAGGSVAHGLVHAWPAYTAYAISFLTIGIIWVNHHTVMQQIGRVDRTFLFINVVFLMIVAFSPFPTRVLASTLRDGSQRRRVRVRPHVHADGDLLRRHVVLRGRPADGCIRADADPRVVTGISRSFAPGSVIYAAATLSAFLSAYLAVALFGAIALFYVVESSLFGGDGTQEIPPDAWSFRPPRQPNLSRLRAAVSLGGASTYSLPVSDGIRNV